MNTMTNIETIRTEKIDTLNDLIAITRDSATFYNDAAKSVSNPGLKSLFGEMASSKNGLVGAMSKEVRGEGATPATTGTVRGAWDKLYGEVRSQFGDANYGYVSQLESSEDRLMKAFNEVVADDNVPASVKQTVSSYLPTIRSHHDLMRDRKWDMKASTPH
ncbi:MAG: PA2169 family four-helix-bundle protein [Pseudomonadota bacterium]|nr:PA2169 family four-helix-bundle protein [Pseudomonadota bacterium]MDQ3161016.1 PA2169 family four-helix-bundle protein [Pseudomonadota bacterium]